MCLAYSPSFSLSPRGTSGGRGGEGGVRASLGDAPPLPGPLLPWGRRGRRDNGERLNTYSSSSTGARLRRTLVVLPGCTRRRCSRRFWMAFHPGVATFSIRTDFPMNHDPGCLTELKAIAKVSGAENFVGSLCRNLCRIGHFSTRASTKFATKVQNQHFRNRLELACLFAGGLLFACPTATGLTPPAQSFEA